MKKFKLMLSLLCFLIITSSVYAQRGRIYGKVETRRGEKYTGWISWNEDETIWENTFDGNREVEYYVRDDDGFFSRPRTRYHNVTARVKFGYIEQIEFVYSDVTVLHLKDGRKMEIKNGDSDEDLKIIENGYGEFEIDRRDIRKVRFMQEPPDFEAKVYKKALPLYGSVKTRFNETYIGYIKWDNDESLTTDILNGKDNYGIKRDIPFGNIKSIKQDWAESRVVLTNGREISLGGSNDVNRDNRGILVYIPNKFSIKIDWRDFDEIEFMEQYKAKNYDDYRPADRLYGTLETYSGEKFEGYIQWDSDESHTCDILDGEYNRMEIKIEFAAIKEIRYNSKNSARVTLKSGETMVLRGSNDVTSDNNGIVVSEKDDGKNGKVFFWNEFEKVTFK